MAKPRSEFTEAEQKAWEAEMKAAGIRIVTDAPSTVTLLAKRATETTTDADGSETV